MQQQARWGLSDRGQSRHDCGISSGSREREPPMNFRFGEITNGSHGGEEHHRRNFLRKRRCRFSLHCPTFHITTAGDPPHPPPLPSVTNTRAMPFPPTHILESFPTGMYIYARWRYSEHWEPIYMPLVIFCTLADKGGVIVDTWTISWQTFDIFYSLLKNIRY